MIYGKGYNSGGKHVMSINRKHTASYNHWRNMLKRCYNAKYHLTHQTYIGCFVCDEWLDFQNFAEWYDSYYVKGFELDKDLTVLGNKCYHPDLCEFIPSQINSLLTDRGNSRGDLPVGVCFHKKYNKYQARCNVNGKNKSLGYSDDPQISFSVYKKFKEKHIKEMADEYREHLSDAIYNNLVNYSIKEN